MQLWTIQPIEWYKKLLDNGIIYGDKQQIEWIKEIEFDYAYQWLIGEMNLRIGSIPNKNSYPIWAWNQYHNSKQKRPDLRSTGFLPKGAKGVRIELEKPAKEVLLSDFNLWMHVLNYWHIADNEEEENGFDKLLELRGIKFVDKEKYTPDIRKIVEISWNKIFDMNYSPEYAAETFEKKHIQATFWSLSVNEIKKVDYFIAR
jgi:hypothetical protein